MKTSNLLAAIILVIIFLNNISGQGTIKKAPINPDYLQFLEEYATGKAEEMMAAPSPYQLNFDQYFKQKELLAPESYPIAYDMRTAGPGGTSLLTSVKHQLGCGACWAFATYGSIESTWKIMGLGDNDFSENNLKNCSGFDLDPCQWGHHFMSTAYLIRGSGPITEVDDPYDPVNGPCTEGLTPDAYIPESRYLPEDHDAFKHTIMNLGAVYNTFKSTANYQWINGHYTYCYQGPGTTSHAIAIVGWNDTLTTACGQGAWLCKNEYGTGFGEDGFFYISYQDTLVLQYNSVWPYKEEYDPELKIYQYDTIGGWPFLGYEDPVVYGLIKYEAEGDQFITRIGTYTVSYGTYLSAEIYDDFDGNTLSNLLATIPEQFCDYAGFWQMDLPDYLTITEGQDFYIKVKYNSPGEDFPLVVEGTDPGWSSPFLETGKCWTSPDESFWEAVGNGTPNDFDLCIKAYAFDITELNIKVLLEGPFNGTDMNTDLIGSSDFPMAQPYNISPWNYDGTESIESIPDPNIVDWVLVELRETDGGAGTANSSTKVSRHAGFLRNDGNIVSVDGSSNLIFDIHVRDNLFVVIYHRNHLPVMSANPAIEIAGIYQYDFTNAIDKAYNSGQKYLGYGKYGMIGGDGFVSGLIDDDDKTLVWEIQAGEEGYKEGDFNMNQQVANPDKDDIWKPNLNSGSQVPE